MYEDLETAGHDRDYPEHGENFLDKAIDFMVPVYDFFFKHVHREHRFREPLLEMSDLRGGETVLDIGCGTGTYAMMMADSLPDGEVHGIDYSERLVDHAKGKAGEQGYDIEYRVGPTTALPYDDNTFDVVSSTLFFPYLNEEETKGTLEEVYRVLKPGGRFVSYDMVEFPQNRFFDNVRKLIGDEPGLLDGLYSHDVIEGAGFTIVDERVGPKFKVFYDTKFFVLEKPGVQEQ